LVFTWTRSEGGAPPTGLGLADDGRAAAELRFEPDGVGDSKLSRPAADGDAVCDRDADGTGGDVAALAAGGDAGGGDVGERTTAARVGCHLE
jgi:hypothetical protein